MNAPRLVWREETNHNAFTLALAARERQRRMSKGGELCIVGLREPSEFLGHQPSPLVAMRLEPVENISQGTFHACTARHDAISIHANLSGRAQDVAQFEQPTT